MHRFLSHTSLTANFVLTEEHQIHQIAHVFRAKKGDKVVFFESNGEDFIYEVVDMSKSKITFVQKGKIENTLPKKSHTLTVFQAFPNKISTLETIVQKLVEIGVGEIILFSSQHSQLRDIPSVKKKRITLIAQEALEQCGGNVPILISYFTEETIEQIFQKYDYLNHII